MFVRVQLGWHVQELHYCSHDKYTNKVGVRTWPTEVTTSICWAKLSAGKSSSKYTYVVKNSVTL